MTTSNFMQVDVFTDTPYRGNPVAVVLDARGLPDESMQRIARWTNLSETTFVLPAEHPEADYRLRIFTPGSELPFAGHPTLGSAHALLQSGQVAPRAGRLVQQCGAGLVSIAVDADAGTLWLTLPDPRRQPVDAHHAAILSTALGVPLEDVAERIDVGPVWITARVADGTALLAARPDMARLARLSQELGAIGVTVFGSLADGSADHEVRSFAPAVGVPEDPVCGSGNGCVAAYLQARGETRPYRARQGRAIGRDGRIRVRFRDSSIEIGGAAVTCIRGEIRLDAAPAAG